MSRTLEQAVQVAGYYPALTTSVVRSALGDEYVVSHFVHAETTFDDREVRRHMTVLVLTPSRLIRVHVDDGAAPGGGVHEAQATSESVKLSAVTSMALTHVVERPEQFTEADTPTELVLAVTWPMHRRIDLEPATCGDESCEADHGYTGALAGDDVLVRVSAVADGEDAVRALSSFAGEVQAAIGRAA